MAHSHRRVYLGLVLTMVFWGSAFPTSKMLVLEVPPEVGAALRLGIGSLLMVALLFRRSAKPVPDRDVWPETPPRQVVEGVHPLLDYWGEVYSQINRVKSGRGA